MHNKNIDKCGKSPQSARSKPNYHTKCGKNCHKILSVYDTMGKCKYNNVLQEREKCIIMIGDSIEESWKKGPVEKKIKSFIT